MQKIAVLLSSYNGSDYLDEQLKSLFEQDFSDYILYVRDDGSDDGTRSIFYRYKECYKDRVFLIEDSLGNLGAANSFLEALRVAHGFGHSYFMFCDQDDVWLPNKISSFYEKITRSENSLDKFPVLVFGDMFVVDERLRIVSDSFWGYQKILANCYNDWKVVAVSNCVTGCSCIFNRESADLLMRHSSIPVLHDLFIATMVAKEGKLVPMHTPTMYYRQHGANVEGASKFGAAYLIGRFRSFLRKSIPRYIKFFRLISLSPLDALRLKIVTTVMRIF